VLRFNQLAGRVGTPNDRNSHPPGVSRVWDPCSGALLSESCRPERDSTRAVETSTALTLSPFDAADFTGAALVGPQPHAPTAPFPLAPPPGEILPLPIFPYRVTWDTGG
jgi:hypothetical protein